MSYYNGKKVISAYYNRRKVGIVEAVDVIINITATMTETSSNVRFFSGDSDVIGIIGTHTFLTQNWHIDGGSIFGIVVDNYTHTQQIPITSRKTLTFKNIPVGSVLSFYGTRGTLNGESLPTTKATARNFTINKNTTFKISITW